MSHQDKLVALTRLGFAARGLLYLVIAWLVVRTGNAEDLSGALRYLRDGGSWLLIILAIGFVAYGLWRLADASLDTEGHGDDSKAIVKRLGAAASGVIYLLLAFQAYRLIQSPGGGGGGAGGSPEQQTQAVMQLPAGGLLVGIGAAILIGAGLWQIVGKAVKARFLDNLDASAARESWVEWFGRIGYGARGIIFLVTGYFLAQAAISGDSSEAGGMEQALQWLSGPVSLLVAAGLALFGIFSFVEARHRVIRGPNLDRMR